MVVAAAVAGPPLATPPASPVIGQCHIVAASPTGAWAGQAHKVAAYTSGGWRFVAPRAGMTALVESDQTIAAYRAGAWELGIIRGFELVLDGLQVVGPRAAAIGAPAGGPTVDAEARTAIGQILTALRQHGFIEM